MNEFKVTFHPFTCSLVPAKIVLDWKALFIVGRPLYESDTLELENSIDVQSSFMTTVSSMDGLKPATSNDRVLNNIDFNDYKVSPFMDVLSVNGSM